MSFPSPEQLAPQVRQNIIDTLIKEGEAQFDSHNIVDWYELKREIEKAGWQVYEDIDGWTTVSKP